MDIFQIYTLPSGIFIDWYILVLDNFLYFSGCQLQLEPEYIFNVLREHDAPKYVIIRRAELPSSHQVHEGLQVQIVNDA
jgi:hypothetical protein